MKSTLGIHHITAIVGHPQENVDFYAGILGMRFVKQTVNFDDPGTYHFYFGNDKGEPGTIITFFPWANSRAGQHGGGQAEITMYAIPVGSMSFWKQRLADFSVNYIEVVRFGTTYLRFIDPHGLVLELAEDARGASSQWSFNGVTPEVAIKGFIGAYLQSTDAQSTIDVLENVLGLRYVAQEKGVRRYTTDANFGHTVDIEVDSRAIGQMGVGTVHHVAFRSISSVDQLEWRQLVQDAGLQVTPVQDRNYFTSIYFREPGHILFEIATDQPGFTVDEPLDRLGSTLKLPRQYEQYRGIIEKKVLPFTIREVSK